MLTSLFLVMSFATSAVSLTLPAADGPEDTKVPMEGEYAAAVEEASRKQRSVTKGNNGIVRTVYQEGTLRDGSSKELSTLSGDLVDDPDNEEPSSPAGYKWIIAVLPPLLIVAFVIFIRNAAEKAKQDDANDFWFNAFLRMSLIQQALAVAGPEKKAAGVTEDNAELGQSLLHPIKEEEDEDGGGCPESAEATAASPLLQPTKDEEDEEDVSAKLFASLAESLYQDEMDDDDDEIQVMAADATVPKLVEHVERVDDSEWTMFQSQTSN